MISFENSDSVAISRRRFLRRGAITVAGAAALTTVPSRKVHACMECVTEKLNGRYPIGKTALVGDQVIPISAAGEAAGDPAAKAVSAGTGWGDGTDEISDDV